MKDKTIIKVSVRSPLRLEISVHYYQPQSTMMQFDKNLNCLENIDLSIGILEISMDQIFGTKRFEVCK